MGLTGCPESEDVELTIMSSRVNGSPLFKWKRNGEVERTYHSQTVKSEFDWKSTFSPKIRQSLI